MMNCKKYSSVLVIALALCACSKTVPGPEFAAVRQDDSFVSIASGETVSSNTVVPGELVIKVDDALGARIREIGADVAVLNCSTRAEDAPFGLVRPVKMERMFPDAGEYEKRTRESGLDRWYVLSLPQEVSLAEAEKAFFGKSGIEQVSFRRRIVGMFDNKVIPFIAPGTAPSATGIFNDPDLAHQWHYYNDGSKNGMAAGSDINVFPAWESGVVGSGDVIVSVVDGGVDYTHPDLAANMWTDPQTGSCGFNFVNNSINVTSDDHGTHVAGTIGAVNNNGIGVCGIAGGDYKKGVPGVRIMSCQIFMTEGGVSRGGDAARAIKWSADHGAVISQNSWGYNYDRNDDGQLTGSELTEALAARISPYEKEAVDYFIKYAGCDNEGNQLPDSPMKGGVVIFAAGNDNIANGAPGNYEPVVAVGSFGADYIRAYYSNYGEWVDISAPGGDAYKGYNVLSTIPGGRYGSMQGTSMACPHVSGVAALIVSCQGGEGFTNENLKNILISTANEELLKYNSLPLGAGMVDAEKAVAGGSREIEHTIAPESGTSLGMKPSQTREIAFLLNNPAGHPLEYGISPALKGITVQQDPAKPGMRLVVSVDGRTLVGDGWNEKHDYRLTLTVTCPQDGQTASCEFSVSVDANQAPAIIRPMTGFVAEQLGAASVLNLASHFFDADGEALEYTVGKTDIGTFAFNNGNLVFTPSAYGFDEVEVTASDTFGASVTGKLPLLVRDGVSRQVDMYPNPVKDKLYFRASDSFSADVRIYSADGACVVASNVEISPFAPGEIDMGALPGGIYTVKLVSGRISVDGTVVKL